MSEQEKALLGVVSHIKGKLDVSDGYRLLTEIKVEIFTQRANGGRPTTLMIGHKDMARLAGIGPSTLGVKTIHFMAMRGFIVF